MSIYNQLKKIEASAPFRDEALELIDKDYRENTVAKRIKNGEDLESIADDILSKRKFGLGFKQRERKDYNKQIEDLSEFAPSSSRLKAHSVIYPFTESKLFASVYGGSLLAMVSGMNSDIYGNAFAYTIEEIGIIALFTLFGAAVGYMANKSTDRSQRYVKEEVKYIKRKLEVSSEE